MRELIISTLRYNDQKAADPLANQGWDRLTRIEQKYTPRVYYARAIDGVDIDGTLRSARLTAQLLARIGLLLVDPLVDEPPPVLGDPASCCQAIVDHDLAKLKTCDAVLMDMSILNRNYIGCSCELVYAHLWKIPSVVYLGENDQNRPWLRYHASAVVVTQAEAIECLRSLL